MTTYDAKTVTGLAAAQFDGTQTSIDAILAICSDARADPTMERTVRVPTGLRNVTHTMKPGDWIVAVTATLFAVLGNTAFTTLFQASA